MICYKDRTFCTKRTCKHWDTCDRALTEEVQRKADEWWNAGPCGAPIATFTGTPKCYESKYKEEK